METREAEDLEKPCGKSASGSKKIGDRPTKMRPEFLSKEETSQETHAPSCYTPIRRNSAFNRTVRRKSKKTGSSPEGSTCHPTESLENGKSINEPLTLNVSQIGIPPWSISTQTDPGAQKTRPAPSLCLSASM